MAWLLREGDVLASLDVARSPAERREGAAGLASGTAVLLMTPARSTHSIGLREGIDVAFLDNEWCVISLTRLRRFQFALPRKRACAVLEARPGTFERWGLQIGDVLEVRQ